MLTCHAKAAAAAVGLVAFVIALPVASAAASTTVVTSARGIAAQLVAAGAPGAVTLTRSGAATQISAAGAGQLDPARPMTASDHVRIASLTKTYVATVVLQLVDEHRLTLDEPAARWLPGVLAQAPAVTVRQLLNHTSGLVDFVDDPAVFAPYLAGDLGFVWAPRQLVDIALAHPPLFPPGERYSYSNTNYVLAGLVVEAVTGRPLNVELTQRIFTPLRLHATSFPTTTRLPNPYAHGYINLGGPGLTDVTALYPFPWAAGAIVADVRDVGTFYRALLRGDLLSSASLEQMLTTVDEHGTGDVPGARYGLGIESFPTPCGTAWGHGGDIPGYLTYAWTSRDGDRQVVLSVNESASSLPAGAGALVASSLVAGFCDTPAAA